MNLDAKPNFKIGSGKYLCPACMEKAKATKFAMNAKNVPAAAAAKAALPADDNSFLLGIGSKTGIAEVGTKPCPECGRALTADAVICTGCGFNTQSGKRTRVRVLKPEKADDGQPKKAAEPITKNPHFQGACVMIGFAMLGIGTIESPALLPIFGIATAVLGLWSIVICAIKCAQVYESGLAALIIFVPLWRDYVMLFKQESIVWRWCWATNYTTYIFLGIALAASTPTGPA
ncbi:MAG: hypothetical protein WC718_01030 [Phycisphaerales bacterium]